MTPYAGTDQSVETMILKEHTWKTGEYFAETPPEISPKIPAFKKEKPQDKGLTTSSHPLGSSLCHFLSPLLSSLLPPQARIS